MRATRQEQTGGAGVSEVSAAFERLDWGVVENARHDLGTDLFVLARDERLFDLGLVVGVQVKAGDSWFDEPAYDSEGNVVGWWFRDSTRSHVDAWVAHALPHLLVLHDLNTRVSYWVHVTSEDVVSTGKGAKVLVPTSNRVDDDHRQALLDVAATLRPATSWEGSAWTGAEVLLPRDLLRYALVVPRLVAPHPNVGHNKAIGPEQAIALLMQARLHDLVMFAKKHDEVPSIEEAVNSDDWSWRFVSALGHRLTTGETDVLLNVVPDAPNSTARAASTVVAAAGLLEEGQVDEAIPLLEAMLTRDEAEPVDHAWLTVQHARACIEVGRIDEARTSTVAVQAIRQTHPDDVTATAMAGTAAELLFGASPWGERRVAEVIASGDTTASWWRRQTTARGLAAVVDRTFKEWSCDTSVTLGARDQANDELLAASLAANHVGDHGEWRYLTGLLAQDGLLRLGRDTDPAEVRGRLSTLRRAGSEKTLKLAVRRLVNNGPARAVRLEAADVRLESSTRTIAPSDLALLQYGGDVLDVATADRSVEWLLETLYDWSSFVARTRPTYSLPSRLLDTLAAVVPAASVESMHKVVERLVSSPAQEDQLIARSWARVVDALPRYAWSEESALRATTSADGHHWELRWPLLGAASSYDPAARSQLLDEAHTGSLDALSALGDVRNLSSSVVEAVVDRLAERADQIVRDAHNGQSAFGGTDIGQALVLLNVWHSESAHWDSLCAMLADVQVNGSHKRIALRTLASLAEQIPVGMQPTLAEIAANIASAEPSQGGFFWSGERSDATGPAGDLLAALGALDDNQSANRLLDLMAGDSDQRKWVARVARRLARPEDTGILTTLAHDTELDVRAAAAAALASLVAEGLGGKLSVYSLERCVQDPGTQVPKGIVTALAGVSELSQGAQDVVESLRFSPSAHVRRKALERVERTEH